MSFISDAQLKLGNFLLNNSSSNNKNRYYCLSFPKCGRTWLRSLINHYYYILYPLSVTQEDYLYASKKPIIRFTHLGKTLSGHDLNKRLSFLKKKKTILIFRDPRDVFVSYYMHITKAGHHPNDNIFDWDAVSISEVLRSEKYGILQIVNYMNSIIEMTYDSKNTFLISYENLKKDSKKEFSSLLNFLGDSVISQRAIDQSIEYCSFSRMQKREKEGIANEFQISTRTRKRNDSDSLKMRKGKVGGFRNNLFDSDLDYSNEIYNKLNDKIKSLILD